MAKVELETTVRTGESCPEDGNWAPQHALDKTKLFKKGAKMPVYNWMAVTWVLKSYADA
jgi:hypothetical protein